MKNLTVTVALVTTLATAPALAEPHISATHGVPAVSNAFEIAVGASYAQGTGDLGGAMPALDDVAGPGLGLDVALGYRATPQLLLGVYTGLAGFGHPDDNDNGAVTAALGIKADWHFLPAAKHDPWISVGTGLKFMGIEDGDRDRALTGLELVKLQAGLDYRVSPRFAIGPVIGASATMYRTGYDDDMAEDGIEIDDKDINWTFSVGVLGRFDAFATTR